MKHCENCGCLIRDTERACPGCGMVTERPESPLGGMIAAAERENLRHFVLIGRSGRPGETAVAGVSSAAPTVIALPRTDAAGRPVTMIVPGAFRGRPLTQIDLPDTVDTIGSEAFADCTRLCRVTGGRGVRHVAAGSFRGCFMLEGCDFLNENHPRGKADVDWTAFAGCYTLTLAGENR